ncbi:MAG: glycosyltransferase [Gammaproteobacteria bacterium]|nr:glycosyltransferase [Gammaproteobacteria bacterium]
MAFAKRCYRCGDYGWLTGWVLNRSAYTAFTTPTIVSNTTMPLIQVFARPPVAGKVKTRLIPDLGVDNATAVYRYCLRETLELLNSSELDFEIWLSEAGTDPLFAHHCTQLQQGVDLGARMHHALQQGLVSNPGDSAILIGSDCLDLNLNHFTAAIATLKTRDMVLLPCFDGGFALIGCRKIEPLIFAGVDWGSSQVLEQTLQNAKLLNYKTCILETVRDIDTLEDLNHYPALCKLVEDN